MNKINSLSPKIREDKCIALICYQPFGDLPRNDWDRVPAIDLEWAAQALALAGFTTIVFETSDGRDVQCMPREYAPLDLNYPNPDSGIVWAIQHRTDNYWCYGESLDSVLHNGDWNRAELRGIRV